LPAPDGGKRHRRCGNQAEAVNRSGINALHWVRGQAALIVTGNHTREQQTTTSRKGSSATVRCANGRQRTSCAIAATVAGAVLR
jgi:hypothetical protein